jgi:hypothetical protein
MEAKMLCSSCNTRPGKPMHLEGSAGSRPLCPRCAELRRARIQRSRLADSLHLDVDQYLSNSATASRDPPVPVGVPVEPTSEFSRGRWNDASVASRP